MENKATKSQSTLERIEARRKGGSTAAREKQGHTFFETIRGTLDALIFAYLLAMFLRTFVFELYMIPTGSMTPTLIGDSAGDIVFFDYNGDGIEDIAFTRFSGLLQIFIMDEGNRARDIIFLEAPDQVLFRAMATPSPRRTDMIVVNKFAYWFHPPTRGDIAVFKVPDRPDSDNPGRSVFDPTKPVYIKRVVGLPGEFVELFPGSLARLDLDHPQRRSRLLGGTEFLLLTERLRVDGEFIDDPIIDTIDFFSRPARVLPEPTDGVNQFFVGDNAVLLIGDNSTSSKDGRYWGDVPLSHLRGRAILRYWPLSAFGFLD